MPVSILPASNPITMALMGLVLSSGIAILPVIILQYSVVDEMADRLSLVRNDESYDFIVGKIRKPVVH